MCRWLAYRGESIFLDDLISRPDHSLIAQARRCTEAKVDTNGDGFGIGWYGEREVPGLYRDTQPAWGDDNLMRLVHQIRSGLFFAHVRASTGTATSRANCHPFAVGKYMFMHNGQIGGYDKVRRRVENLINDHYYQFRQGTTDSEALFLAILSHGFEVDPYGAVQQVLKKVRALMTEAGVTCALRVTAAISDGERLYAIRYSSDSIVPSLYYRLCSNNLTVVSEPLDETATEWHAVPSGHFLAFGGIAAPSFMPLDIAPAAPEVLTLA
ncbi:MULTISPECIES: class II glutamine amidotransferase [Pseudovibrio]|uniref:class II glutamine amidotransferase n=1 Tax=Stappiaceae TaxID=2821832 RepID=UPI00236696CA|nr:MULTISPECIES: class II glutamine amidotransferase [Pseudovibrio]MDD7911878.1 class II glutamine amidotransferase [Pseudovibrio exalbescens]MDX5594675.1 class II glutamine amidotransferase [Pseudovibrio sp. SPO723]